mmetsp:Transcript_32112/g.84794  ORF Transcript_32112/g.84794 Transcript_32112/m.84794 type:complete len:200 (-) Transcript_32112:736-1335(-)
MTREFFAISSPCTGARFAQPRDDERSLPGLRSTCAAAAAASKSTMKAWATSASSALDTHIDGRTTLTTRTGRSQARLERRRVHESGSQAHFATSAQRWGVERARAPWATCEIFVLTLEVSLSFWSRKRNLTARSPASRGATHLVLCPFSQSPCLVSPDSLVYQPRPCSFPLRQEPENARPSGQVKVPWPCFWSFSYCPA